MKRIKNFGIAFSNSTQLTRQQMKKVMGGQEASTTQSADSCNAYCGDGSGYTCSGKCSTCDDAGNGQNPNVPGGDKLCVQFA